MERLPSIRASDSDREHVAERLRHATSEGRLTRDELEERLEALYGARTYGDLDALVADLPVPYASRQPGLRIRRWVVAAGAVTLALGLLGMLALSRVHVAMGVVGGGHFRHLHIAPPLADPGRGLVLAASTGAVLMVLLAGAVLLWVVMHSRSTHDH